MSNKLSKWLIGGIVSISLLSVGLALGAFLESNNIPYAYKIAGERLELSYQGAKDSLVNAIDNHIRVVAPESCMNGLAIVEACDEYDVDIIFVLSQAYIEGHYATKGIAYKTNSAFNVGAYDGKKDKYVHKYDHPDHSIKPYLVLLKTRYLVDNKTELDLMDKYVDLNGNRYASDEAYEAKLSYRYNYIIDNTNLEYLCKTYKRYKNVNK